MFGNKKDKPTTLEEVRKAYENLSDDDKESFHQSIADRIHESIGEQEKENGQKDEQSAAAREHEALGEEHAEGNGDADELNETDADKSADDKAEIKAEEKHEETFDDHVGEREDFQDKIKDLEARIANLEEGTAKTPKKASEEEADYLTSLERKYNK